MGELRKFNEECLAAHNGLRKAHKVGSLTYDENLARAAQAYAEKLAKMKIMEHSENSERPNIGENLAFCNKPFVNYKYSGRGASVSWYSEIKDYDFTKESQTTPNPTGHFTQVIWKDSKQAGFGRAQSSDQSWYIVGRYAPQGNFLGKYMDNVPRCLHSKWEDVPVVQEYLEELRTWEFTKTRKHVLDNWTMETKGSNKNGVTSWTLTENFESKIYGHYSGTAEFTADPSNLPRPEFRGHNENNHDDYHIHENDNNKSHDDYHIHENDNNKSHEDDEKFENAVLQQHNVYRKKHNVPLLKLNNKLSKLAQDWAEKMANKNKTEFSNLRYNNSEVGENISLKFEEMSNKTGERLVDNWYEEQKLYIYNKEPDNFQKVGHFTQLVWKESSEIGIGLAKNSSGHNYIVCFYYPPGNVERLFAKNVVKPFK